MLDFSQDPLFGAKAHTLLLLWAPEQDSTFDLRVVRPIEAGKYGGQVATDFCMELAPTKTAFEGLSFVGEDHDEDLFMTIHSDERKIDGEGAAR